MTNRTWNGATDLFFNAPNWTPFGAPQVGDVAIINSGTAIDFLSPLTGIVVQLNGSTSSAPTLQLIDSTVSAGTVIAASSAAPIGYAPATIAVQGTVTNN